MQIKANKLKPFQIAILLSWLLNAQLYTDVHFKKKGQPEKVCWNLQDFFEQESAASAILKKKGEWSSLDINKKTNR